jgi:hypothetical protein
MSPDCGLYKERLKNGDHPLSYCLRWNSALCDVRECKFKHVCLHCHSRDHASVDCVHALITLINREFGANLAWK